jgi:hypothetical protein
MIMPYYQGALNLIFYVEMMLDLSIGINIMYLLIEVCIRNPFPV